MLLWLTFSFMTFFCYLFLKALHEKLVVVSKESMILFFGAAASLLISIHSYLGIRVTSLRVRDHVDPDKITEVGLVGFVSLFAVATLIELSARKKS